MSFDKINVWFVGSFFWRARCALSDPHMLSLWRPFANWSYQLYYIITFSSDQSHIERPMQFDQHVLQYHFSCSFVLIVTDFLTHNSIPVHCFNVVTIQWKRWQNDNEIQAAWKVAARNELERCMCQLSDRIPYDAHFTLLAEWRIRIRPVRVSREPRANRNQITRDWIISLLLLHCISLLRWSPEFCSNINTNLKELSCWERFFQRYSRAKSLWTTTAWAVFGRCLK